MSSSPSEPSASARRARRRLAEAGLEVLLEDNHLLVVAKAAGLPSQGGPRIDVHVVSLVEAYRRETGNKPGRAYVGLVHRLDRNVSGVMVLAKTSKAARRLAAAFRDRAGDLRKVYLAWVAGRPRPAERRLVHRLRRSGGVTTEAAPDDPEGREAALTYRVEGEGTRAARLLVEPASGRTHQIRAQLALTGHPLVGDQKYGGPPAARPSLHALRLIFPHPVREGLVDVRAPVPEDLRRLDRSLGIRPPVEPSPTYGA